MFVHSVMIVAVAFRSNVMRALSQCVLIVTPLFSVVYIEKEPWCGLLYPVFIILVHSINTIISYITNRNFYKLKFVTRSQSHHWSNDKWNVELALKCCYQKQKTTSMFFYDNGIVSAACMLTTLTNTLPKADFAKDYCQYRRLMIQSYLDL